MTRDPRGAGADDAPNADEIDDQRGTKRTRLVRNPQGFAEWFERSVAT